MLARTVLCLVVLALAGDGLAPGAEFVPDLTCRTAVDRYMSGHYLLPVTI